jgi:hypothetical protein
MARATWMISERISKARVRSRVGLDACRGRSRHRLTDCHNLRLECRLPVWTWPGLSWMLNIFGEQFDQVPMQS